MVLKEGDRVIVSGNSDTLWINDYNVRVSTFATVLKTPNRYDKKVLLSLDEIDGEHNVICMVRRTKVILDINNFIEYEIYKIKSSENINTVEMVKTVIHSVISRFNIDEIKNHLRR